MHMFFNQTRCYYARTFILGSAEPRIDIELIMLGLTQNYPTNNQRLTITVQKGYKEFKKTRFVWKIKCLIYSVKQMFFPTF